MSIRGNVTNLAGLVYAGAQSWDLNALPPVLTRADCPVLVPRYVSTREAQDSLALQQLVYDGSAWWATVYIEHLYYYAPVGAGLYGDARAALVAFLDTYYGVIKGAGFLQSLDAPLDILSAEICELAYPPGAEGGARFDGIRFVHRWKVKI